MDVGRNVVWILKEFPFCYRCRCSKIYTGLCFLLCFISPHFCFGINGSKLVHFVKICCAFSDWAFRPVQIAITAVIINLFDITWGSLDKWSGRRKACTYTGQQNKETRIGFHAFSGIRTYDTSDWGVKTHVSNRAAIIDNFFHFMFISNVK